jgi:hypothetical protein
MNPATEKLLNITNANYRSAEAGMQTGKAWLYMYATMKL